MPCGQLCYNYRWHCRPGRLRRLNLQNKPNPTRDYGSLGARENYIRRRTAARIRKPTAKCYNYKGEQCNQYIAYGPRFGLRKRPTVCCCPDGDPKCQHTKSSWFRSNGGSGSDVTFWKRISAGPANLMPSCLGTPRCSPSQEDQCMDCMGWYRPCPWNGRYWEGKGWNRNWERTGKPPDEAVGGEAVGGEAVGGEAVGGEGETYAGRWTKMEHKFANTATNAFFSDAKYPAFSAMATQLARVTIVGIIVIGGSDWFFKPLAQTWLSPPNPSSPGPENWQPGPELNTARYGHVAVGALFYSNAPPISSSIIVLGGYTPTGTTASMEYAQEPPPGADPAFWIWQPGTGGDGGGDPMTTPRCFFGADVISVFRNRAPLPGLNWVIVAAGGVKLPAPSKTPWPPAPFKCDGTGCKNSAIFCASFPAKSPRCQKCVIDSCPVNLLTTSIAYPAMKSCEWYNPGNNKNGRLPWVALPDMKHPRCGHAVVTGVQPPYTAPGQTPVVYVLGGCQVAYIGDDGQLTLGGDVSAPLTPRAMNSVEYLSLTAAVLGGEGKVGEWQQGTPMKNPRGGNSFVAVTAYGKIYAMGGDVVGSHMGETDFTLTMEVFTPYPGSAKGEWEIVMQTAPLSPSARGWVKNCAYGCVDHACPVDRLPGGAGPSCQSWESGDTWCNQSKKNCESCVTEKYGAGQWCPTGGGGAQSLPFAPAGVTQLGRALYIIGAERQPPPYGDNQTPTQAAASWLIPTVSSSPASTGHPTSNIGCSYMKDIENYQKMTTMDWEAGIAMPYSRTGGAAVVLNNTIYALGGFCGFPQNPCQCNTPECGVKPPACTGTTTSCPTPPGGFGPGGALYGGPMATVISFDPTKTKWDTALTSMGETRQGLAVAVVADKVCITGGMNTPATSKPIILASAELFDPDTNTWATKVPQMGTARVFHASATLQGKLYVMGGIVPKGGPTTTGSTEVYDPVANAWAPSTNLLTTRFGASATELGGKIYVAGGQSTNNTWSPLASVEIFDITTNTWYQGPSMPTTRYNHAATACNGKLYVTGGWANDGNTVLASVEVYDPATQVWASAAPMGAPRSGHSAATLVVGGTARIYVLGGITQNKNGGERSYFASVETLSI